MLSTLDKYKERYLLLLPALLLFVVFRYVPMAGIVLAWKQFNVTLGLFASPWAGWKYFERLFAAPDFFRVLRNTVFINGVLRMGIAFFMPIIPMPTSPTPSPRSAEPAGAAPGTATPTGVRSRSGPTPATKF